MNIIIKKVSTEKSEKIIDYVMASRKNIFPMLNNITLPTDLQNFKAAYLTDKSSAFFVALDSQNNIAGTIGLLQYDNRFTQFYQPKATCEIVKLYVSPQYRRMGLASKLIAEAAGYAMQQDVEKLYLHTHPFLTGAKEIWQKNGFEITLQEEIPVWKTIHMEYKLF